MNLIVTLTVFFTGLGLLAINVVLFLLKKNKTQQEKILTAYLILSFIEGFGCYSLYFLTNGNNFFTSHIFFILQLLFVSYFYKSLFTDNKLKNFIKLTVAIILFLLIFQYAKNFESFFQFNLLETTSISCFIVVLAIIYIYKTLGENKPYFYFSLGLLMYFLCTCFVYLSGNISIVLSQDPHIDQWIFKDLFFIVFQILIFVEYKNLKNTNDR